MTRPIALALYVSVLALTACAPRTEAPTAAVATEPEVAGADSVHMDAETQARMGVVAAPIAATSASQMADGFARVMDVGPLAAIESEVSAAEAAAASSQEEYRRLQALAAQDQAASARSVEQARAQAAADASRAKLAARRIGLEWGASLERMSDGERSRFLSDIAAGRAALLRIDAPGAPLAAKRATVRLDKASTPISVTIFGQAAAADARLQTTGLLGLVRGAAAATLPTGRLLQAELELGDTEDGFLIPESSLLRSNGALFAFAKTGPDTFERREIAAGRAVSGGWFVGDGFAAGDQVVTEGAASVLAAETGPVEAE